MPWLTLVPCDQVHVYYSTTPYRDIVFLSSRGAANRWITIKGIPGPNGELPILDGVNAVMPKNTGANEWVDSTGLIIINRPDGNLVNRSGSYKPGYIHISGLKFQNARPPAKVTKINGIASAWDAFSAGITINGAEQVAITGCEFKDNGLGVFANSTGDELVQTRNLLLKGNYFRGNSNTNSFSEHNAYTEGVGTVYEDNYFAPPKADSYGDNIKDRSAGIIFRNNYIEGGANLIALRDPDSNKSHEAKQVDFWGEMMVASAFVYNNTLVTRNYPDSIIGHGDGPYSTQQIRYGNLYFYSNRVVSTVDNVAYWENGQYYENQAVALFDLINTTAPGGATTVVAQNNLFYATSRTAGATGANLALFYWQGKANFQSNWVNRFQNVREGGGGGTLAPGSKFDGTGLGGLTATPSVSPGFIDQAGGNYLTTTTSPYASLKSALPLAVTKRKLEPVGLPPTRPFER